MVCGGLGRTLFGHQVLERVASVDFFLELKAMAAQEQMPVFYLGAKPEIVENGSSDAGKAPTISDRWLSPRLFWDDEQAFVEKFVSQVLNFCLWRSHPEI